MAVSDCTVTGMTNTVQRKIRFIITHNNTNRVHEYKYIYRKLHIKTNNLEKIPYILALHR